MCASGPHRGAGDQAEFFQAATNPAFRDPQHKGVPGLPARLPPPRAHASCKHPDTLPQPAPPPESPLRKTRQECRGQQQVAAANRPPPRATGHPACTPHYSQIGQCITAPPPRWGLRQTVAHAQSCRRLLNGLSGLLRKQLQGLNAPLNSMTNKIGRLARSGPALRSPLNPCSPS